MAKLLTEVFTTLLFVGTFATFNYFYDFEFTVIFMCSVIIAKIFMLEK